MNTLSAYMGMVVDVVRPDEILDICGACWMDTGVCLRKEEEG